MSFIKKVLGFPFRGIVFYVRLFVYWVTKGFNDRPDDNNILSDDEFYYSFNRIYTDKKVKKVFFIDELPRLVDFGFLQGLKELINREVQNLQLTYGVEGSCELIDIMWVEPYKLNFSSMRNRSRIMMWKRRYEKAMREHGNMSEFDELLASGDDIATVDRNRWMIESWLFIKREREENLGEFCKTNIILELVADSDDILRACEDVLKDFLISNGISYKEIFVQSNEYYKAFSPVSNEDNLLKQLHPPYILSDDVVTSFNTVTHGRVGDERGVLFGNDIYTGLPIFFDLKTGSDAVNFLVTASTAGGKSNYMKGMFSYLDLENIDTIILDYEGDEYTALGRLYDAEFIKMSGWDSKYFNTIAIGDLTGDESIDTSLKQDAIDVTARVFSLLLDEKNGMTTHEESLFSDAVNRVYEKFGVTDDPTTWYRSKEITYFHIYGELVEMSEENQYIENYGDSIRSMVIKLRTYFEHNGINRHLFSEPVNIDDLLGNRHIIFSFGMKGREESLFSSKELALKQLFVGYITSLVSNYNKSKGRLTAIFVEEMQRYLTQEHSSAIVSNMVTGGRKRGMILFLITNSPLQLLNSDTSEKLSEVASNIVGNINGLVIGSLTDDESEALAKKYRLEDSLDVMKSINRQGDLKYSFLVNYKGETTVTKFLFSPDIMENTDLYATRKDQVD